MPLPIPQLDDRRFDDLVGELLGRAASHVPEWRPVPGDPGSALVDLVAYLGETIIYRLNLLPERQRLAFLNLLHLPLRAARPARGVLAIDPPKSEKGKTLPPRVQLAAGNVKLVTEGEVTPLPLVALVVVKEKAADLDARAESEGKRFFRPRKLVPGSETLQPGAAVDAYLHLCCAAPTAKDDAAAIRKSIAGETISVGFVPDRASDGDVPAAALVPRKIVVEIAQGLADPKEEDPTKRQETGWWPLDLVGDTTDGGRAAGVLRLRLPADPLKFAPAAQDDPEYTGAGDSPPEAPADVPGPVVLWLRLRVEDDEDFALGWIGVNAVEVVAQEHHTMRVVGIGTGESDQQVSLGARDVDPDGLSVEVQEPDGWMRWRRVPHFGGLADGDRAFALDPEAGLLRFGDGVRGMRPGREARIQATFLAGGGAAGNLGARSVKEVVGGPAGVDIPPGLKVRQDSPLEGGADAESVTDAERRIPEFLQHRDRAVTADDFRMLALAHPAAPVARAEVRPGLLPVPGSAHQVGDVPGVVSVFVMPPVELAPARPPRPSKGLLADIFQWLSERKVIGTELYVLSPEFVPVAVSLAVHVEDPRAERTVLKAVERAVLEFLFALVPGGFRGDGWPFGAPVVTEEIDARAGRVAGVLSVGKIRMWRGTPQGWVEEKGRITLEDWQLPDLQAVSAQSIDGDGEPSPPGPLTSPEPTGDITPAPTLPDLC